MSTITNRQHAVNESRPRTPAGDAFSRFAFQAIRLANLLAGAGDELARPAGQSSARWLVLAGAESASRTVADVARVLGLARQSVQRVADALETEGLVAYADNPRHRRARLLILTPAGRLVLADIQARQAGWANKVGQRVGIRRLNAATDAITRAQAALDDPG